MLELRIVANHENPFDSNSPNLKSISERLLQESEMKIWGARGLSKFEDNRTGQSLVSSLSEFADREVDEVVEILCGRVNWADALLNGIENGKVAKSLISPYHALQIKSLGNEELNRKLIVLGHDSGISGIFVQAKR